MEAAVETVMEAEAPAQAAPDAVVPGWHASLELGVERRAQGSVLALRRHAGPLRVQKALYPEGPDAVHLLVLHPPGGIAGGDHLRIAATVDTGAHALITTPGAAKWYKAHGRASGQDVHLRVASGAVLEWLPQESIVFDGADAHMRLTVDCGADARVCGWDITVLGRRASGERFASGRIAQRIDIRRDGRLLWAERASIDGGDALLDSPIGWAGAHVSGLMWVLGASVDDALLERCRAVETGALRLGISRFAHGLVLARVLGASPEQVRSVLSSLWSLLRPALCGRAALAPRIWAT